MYQNYEFKEYNEILKNAPILSENNFQCPSYHDATRPYDDDFIHNLKLWPNLMSEYDKKNGETLYGSREALKTIYNHQHPQDCSKVQYMISKGWGNGGFGSQIHVETATLALAMQMNRVLVLSPLTSGGKNKIFHEVPFCQKRDVKGLDCYWESWSNCTLADAYTVAGVTKIDELPILKAAENLHLWENDRNQGLVAFADTKEKYAMHPSIIAESRIDYTTGLNVPDQVLNMYRCAPHYRNPHYSLFSWWLVVAATYFMRPNRFAMEELNNHINSVTFPQNENSRKNSIGVYIRHGEEKSGEMHFLDVADYVKGVELMWREGLVPGSPTATKNDVDDRKYNNMLLPYNGTIFIGSENMSVIEYFVDYFGKYNWKVEYTNLYDRNKDWALTGVGIFHDDRYINMMLNTHLSSQCSGWVSTVGSNFIRVYYELRATAGAKANRFFSAIDKFYLICPDPPCIDYRIENSRKF